MEGGGILRTKAIVLATKDYLETSRLVTLFTEKFGKIDVIAKGYRRPKSQFGNSLEIFTIVDVIIYSRATRELQVVSQSEILKKFTVFSENMIFFAYGSAILELFNKLVFAQDTSSREANEPLFSLLTLFLEITEKLNEKQIKIIFLSFKLKLANLLGYSPNLETCTFCNLPITEKVFYFDFQQGGILHESCPKNNSKNYILINQGILKILQKLMNGTLQTIQKIKLTQEKEELINDIIDKFFQFHVHGYQKLKSIGFWEKMQQKGE